MTTMASQITSLMIVYSIVYSDANQRKHQSSASLAFVRGTHRGPVNSPHKGPVTRKMFPFDDVIMVTWTNADSSPMGFCSISQKPIQISTPRINLKIKNSNLLTNFPGPNELKVTVCEFVHTGTCDQPCRFYIYPIRSDNLIGCFIYSPVILSATVNFTDTHQALSLHFVQSKKLEYI